MRGKKHLRIEIAFPRATQFWALLFLLPTLILKHYFYLFTVIKSSSKGLFDSFIVL